MEIKRTPECEARLEVVARRQGRTLGEVAGEAIAVWLSDHDWAADARRKIEVGWEQSERGEAIDGDESRRRLDGRHAELLGQSQRG